jgi:hypothetical protein
MTSDARLSPIAFLSKTSTQYARRRISYKKAERSETRENFFGCGNNVDFFLDRLFLHSRFCSGR